MTTKRITNTNDFLYAGAVVVAEGLGARDKKGRKPEEPPWKRGLTSQIKGMRCDHSMKLRLVGRI